MTTSLRELIGIAARDVRAIDVEGDAERVEPLAGYVVSAHVLDAARQITIAWQDGPRTRAWSITGPYGAGKSAFAHLLQALHTSEDSALHARAAALLTRADMQLADTLAAERRRLAHQGRGFILAIVRGQREPAADIVTRALAAGAERYWRGRRAPSVLYELRNAAASGLDPEGAGDVVLDWVARLSASAPVLLVIDELGKVLEHAHSRSDDNDLFVLQQLAEWFSGQDKCRGGMLTLQHLAYEDYLTAVTESRRREWRKVQGRFADLPFIPDAEHGHRLLAGALALRDQVPAGLRRAISKACSDAENELRVVAPDAAMPSDATGQAASTYPLHPAAATALPDLAARYGQHDRTLVAFLAGESPTSLPALLDATTIEDDRIPFIRVAHLYDAIVGDSQAAYVPGPDGARLREARARLEDDSSVDGIDLEVAKTIAVLNLVAAQRGLRADVDVIEAACTGPAGSTASIQAVRESLDRLVARGLIVWRQFAGEYRIWRGSDVDLEAVVADERARLAATQDVSSELALLASIRPQRAQVARRHSLQHHLLRFFECRYSAEIPSEPRCHMDGADGLVVIVLAATTPPKVAPRTTIDGRPLVIVYTPYGCEPLEAVIDAAAVARAVESSAELADDPVALREARHRAAMARDAVSIRLDEALDRRRDGVCWFIGGEHQQAGSAADLSKELSDLCDARYPSAPVLRTEMLNRRDLTSQGAKARGELLRSMFEAGDEESLGMAGHGPEASMYHAVLEATGLHQVHDGRWSFGTPNEASRLQPTWDAIDNFFSEAVSAPRPLSELWELLEAPPYGVKDGPIPVLLAAALLHREDDIFLYQDGSFVPSIGPADVERLLKAPARYSVKRATLLGLRAEVFRELRAALVEQAPRGRSRNATTLAVVRPLLAHLKILPDYTRATSALSQRTLAVRDALASATEPDALLFSELPSACGVESLDADAPSDADRARHFVAELRAALRELSGAYELLLARVEGLIRQALRVPRGQRSLRQDLRVRAAHLVEHVIDPRGRGFLATASHDGDDDRDWLEALALNISVKPMTSWTDRDVDLFEAALAERSAWFHRLEALHADQRPQGPGGFSTRLVTVTAPDGRDVRKLVGIDDQARKAMTAVLDTVLSEVGTHDDHPEEALLALLGERLLDTARTRQRDRGQLRRAG